MTGLIISDMAVIKLTIDKEGNPILEFTCYPNRKDLDEKMLNVFAEKAIKNGLTISSPSGGAETGNPEASYTNYIIHITE